MQRVVERILNLLAFLLTVERPVTADEIRHTVAGYDRDGDDAFHRKFERDKQLLRSLGIPIEREATDAFEVEFGYVVDDAYALADPGLTDEERAALSLAVQAVGFGGRPYGQEALMKLGGLVGAGEGTQLGADFGDRADDVAEAFGAISDRRALTFEYRGRKRTVEPRGLVHRRGRWYLVAAERGADAVKVFRLDRAEGVSATGRSGAFTPPAGFDADEWVSREPWEAGEESMTATVAFDADVAWIARRELGARARVAETSGGTVVVEVPVAAPDAFVGWIIGFEDRCEILGPPELRDRFLSLVESS